MNNVVFHMFLCEYFFREKKVHKNFYFSFRFIFFLVFQFFADIGLLTTGGPCLRNNGVQKYLTLSKYYVKQVL